MSYSVRLDEETKERIIGWRLPREGIRAILQRIEELRDFPVRCRLRRISPVDLMFQSDVVYSDSGSSRRDYVLTIAFQYRVDEEVLSIVDCDRVRSDVAH